MRVLCPLDGSARSFRALEIGLNLLAGHGELEVTLFAVMQEGLENAPDHVVEQYDSDESDEIFPNESSARRMLDEAIAACEEAGITAKQKVVRGVPYDEIIEEAKSHDVVLMHRLDQNQLKEKLRFSQSEKLARNLAASVLLVADE